jgi:hypothetical protein
MPLLPSTLTDELMKLDSPNPPQDKPGAADKWATAWGNYVSGCVQLLPGAALLMQQTFKGVISSAFEPGPAPITFFLALEGAMRAGWASAIALPPLLSFIPAPAPFAPLGLACVAVGLATDQKNPPRAALATAIHTWTSTIIVVGPTGPVGPVA